MNAVTTSQKLLSIVVLSILIACFATYWQVSTMGMDQAPASFPNLIANKI